MTITLSIETSTHHFSCAIHRDGMLIAAHSSEEKQTTASMLAIVIDDLFSNNNLKKKDLTGVIVSEGPGSYTGLRIGIATAKGICFALNVPLVSVNTLYLLTYQVIQRQKLNAGSFLCPMIDARRMEVYCAVFDRSFLIHDQVQAKIIDEESFSAYLEKELVYFFGEGSEKCKSIIAHPNARFISAIEPEAAALGEIGYKKLVAGEFDRIENFEPLYLKDFIIKKPKLSF